MRKRSSERNMFRYFSVFLLSLFCLSLELFLTRILNLKTWNHVVYTIIPFSILGYGIGANLCLLCWEKVKACSERKIVSAGFLFFGVLNGLCFLALVRAPVNMREMLSVFYNPKAAMNLFTAYALVLIPFVVIGFVVVYLFQKHANQSHRLYCVDLLGAAAGAYLFFPLIERFEVGHSLFLLSAGACLIANIILAPRRKLLGIAAFLGICALVLNAWPEPRNYRVDATKGWEWIPGKFRLDQYRTLWSQWHPLGRTDIYRILDPDLRSKMSDGNVTFLFNVEPAPEFSYFTTNFLAGTPVYRLGGYHGGRREMRTRLFSQPIEAPYLLLNKPKVLIIGTGGGRDIFMAQSHHASRIFGAEINPATYQAMAAGGVMHEYSGGVYGGENVSVHNVDGRHLVKTLPPGTMDLVLLNGVDTYSGLSSGAYAYAESYLYTKNAVMDYLRVLDDNGLINFNRILFPQMPRETLKLQVIAMDALRATGHQRPWEHLFIGSLRGWSIMLIKKSPFTPEERSTLRLFMRAHGVQVEYPTASFEQGARGTAFDSYARAYQQGRAREFIRSYPYDISAVTDDNPFFYKYYKVSSFNFFKVYALHHSGPVIFLTQLLVILEAGFFTLLFIFVPLLISRRTSLLQIPRTATASFITYFSCLGVGFMFFEIPLMQRFVLLLGSPIYSISVTLAVLLLSVGWGSLSVPFLSRVCRTPQRLILFATVGLVLESFLLELIGGKVIGFFMGSVFAVRILVVALILMPLGMTLGVFFPSGLKLLAARHEDAIAWAWGLNCGFSVLGSMAAIIFAQFSGFRFVLFFACLIYLLACRAFLRLSPAFEPGKESLPCPA